MYLYLKTPLHNHSKYLPHLVEHCSGHSALDVVDFFEFSYGLDGISTPEYTRFEYDKRISREQAVEKVFTPLTKKAYVYESKVLQEELESISYDQRIYEFIVQKYLDKAISLNAQGDASREQVQEYHNKRYHLENTIVLNNDFQPIYQGGNYQLMPKKRQLKILFDEVDFEGDEYFLLLYQNYSAGAYRELYFIFWTLCFYSAYHLRWKEARYYY